MKKETGKRIASAIQFANKGSMTSFKPKNVISCPAKDSNGFGNMNCRIIRLNIEIKRYK